MIVEETAGILTIHPDFLLGFFAVGGSYNSGGGAEYAQILDLDIVSLWRRNAFSFVLLAGMFFPRCDGRFDLRVILFVEAAINGRSIVPAILAETFRGLTLYRLSLDFRTTSGVELLYVWLVAHLFRGHSPQLRWFTDSPLPRLIGQMTTLSHIPQQLDMWVFALGSLTPDTIVWDIGLFSASKYGIIVCGQDLSFLLCWVYAA